MNCAARTHSLSTWVTASVAQWVVSYYQFPHLFQEIQSIAVGFYILLRAVDRFASNYNSFPGQFDGEMDEEISRLKTSTIGLLSDLGCNGSALTEDLINEMCRYGAAELHAVAAFNGIDHKSQLLSPQVEAG